MPSVLAKRALGQLRSVWGDFSGCDGRTDSTEQCGRLEPKFSLLLMQSASSYTTVMFVHGAVPCVASVSEWEGQIETVVVGWWLSLLSVPSVLSRRG